MSDISQVDKNFKVDTKIDKADIKFIDVRSEPISIYGVFHDGEKFRRIPEDVAKNVSEGVYALHANTAGGRIRFKTNSSYIAINAKMPKLGKMPHFALCGSAGFDLYCGERYLASFVPPFNIKDGYEKLIELGSREMRDITINFPLYSDVSELYIGIKDSAIIEKSEAYSIEKPIIYYGSSITQGGCASRPGNSYQAIISRAFDADYINLGFSGNAKGERAISDYIKSQEMSVFVYDYDHNAPTAEHLLNTHERMFLEIREANPSLPIVIMSKPKYYLPEVDKTRREIIKRTYDNAVARGDKNVYFIDGPALMQIALDAGTVDGCHPNDLGFFSMAKALIPVLAKIFG